VNRTRLFRARGAALATANFRLPVIGGGYDTYGAYAAFRNVAVLPAVPTIVFAGRAAYFQKRGGSRAVRIAPGEAR
jgi:hypothetical protein